MREELDKLLEDLAVYYDVDDLEAIQETHDEIRALVLPYEPRHGDVVRCTEDGIEITVFVNQDAK